jgi:hypothetical protein
MSAASVSDLPYGHPDFHLAKSTNLAVRRQEKFAADLFRAFSSGDFEGIAEGHQKISPGTRLFILNVPDDSESLGVVLTRLRMQPLVFRRILLCCFLPGLYPYERRSG